MTTVTNSVSGFNSTLIAAAISVACSGVALAQDVKTMKTISLIKKPISLIKKTADESNETGESETTNNANEVIDNAYDDIARLLNQLPGVFSVNRLPNDNSPIITHHSDPSSGNILLLKDNIAFNPAPFYFKLAKFITPSFFAGGNSVDSSINSIPVVTTSNITSSTAKVEDVANVKLNIGSNNKLGLSIDHGKDNDDFGHRFYIAKQQVDSHREFNNGEKGQFDSNEVFLKIKENSLGNNKKVTQVSLHYKDFSNDESLIGLSNTDAVNSPQHRYSATALDNISGDQLSLGINHQTDLFSGETITTDIYYNTGDINYYQTDSVNDNAVSNSAQLLSDFEASPSGDLTVAKESLDSKFTSIGINIDISQQVEDHYINLGGSYHKEEFEQTQSFDTFNFDQQLALTLLTTDEDASFVDGSSSIKALYFTDHWEGGRWSIDSGIKYLSITDRREYDESSYIDISDDTTVYNLQLSYNFSSSVSAFVGTIQGAVTQLSTEDSGLPELNNQITAGILYKHNRGFISLKAFDNEFENVLARCDSQETCETITDDRTDIEISAIELSGGLVTYFDNWSLPLTFNITSRDAKYSEKASSIDFAISPNDYLAFLPEQQFSLKVGAQFEQFYFGARVEHRGQQRTTLGQNSLDDSNSIDAITLVDFDANYHISKQHLLSFSIENILDEQYTEQAFYSGKMMGRNRFISLKYQYNF